MQAKPEPQDVHRLARSIAFAIRKLGRCMPAEARWLAEYEAKHGKVEL